MGSLRVVTLLALGACAFDPARLVPDPGDDDVVDAAVDAPGADPDVAIDGAPCVPGFLDLCDQAAPEGPFVVAGAETIDTGTDPRCRALTQPVGPEVCLIYATQIDISGTLTATGTRPLALAATGAVTISGEVDVSSRRGGSIGPGADDATCAATKLPEDDPGGAAGGAGGSLGTLGGDGGTGDLDTSIGLDGSAQPGVAGPALGEPTSLRGGCPGSKGGNQSNGGNQGGAGGHGAGAIYVAAGTTLEVTASGRIRATGAAGDGGGAQAGGGGGGSGGLIVLEAPAVTIDGELNANGGGGGEGGANVGQASITGQPGTDGGLGTTPAAGGAGDDDRFGFGGAGGASTTPPVAGTSSDASGGGGGGAVGAIRVRGPRQGNGLISPPLP